MRPVSANSASDPPPNRPRVWRAASVWTLGVCGLAGLTSAEVGVEQVRGVTGADELCADLVRAETRLLEPLAQDGPHLGVLLQQLGQLVRGHSRRDATRESRNLGGRAIQSQGGERQDAHRRDRVQFHASPASPRAQRSLQSAT